MYYCVYQRVSCQSLNILSISKLTDMCVDVSNTSLCAVSSSVYYRLMKDGCSRREGYTVVIFLRWAMVGYLASYLRT